MLPKIVHFLWLCLHNCVPIREVLASRGINCEGRCLCAGILAKECEKFCHLLKECDYAREFWHRLHVPPSLVGYFNCKLHD